MLENVYKTYDVLLIASMNQDLVSFQYKLWKKINNLFVVNVDNQQSQVLSTNDK